MSKALGLSHEQLKERMSYVTATEASVVCGVSPWGNIIDLWNQKIGMSLPDDLSDNHYVKAGLYLEAPIAAWFCDETGKTCVEDDTLKVHKTLPFLAAHTDRVIVNESALLECKNSASLKTWAGIEDNIIPDHYLVQIAHEAMCWDVERVYIAVLLSGNDLKYAHYDRNDKLEQAIIEKCGAFWDCVKNETAPAPRTSAEVQSLYANQLLDEEPLIATQDVEESLAKVREFKSSIESYSQAKEKEEDKIKVYMGKHSILHGSNGKITASWKTTKDRTLFDKSRFEQENGELYGQYTVTKPGSRRFLLK